MNIFSYKIEHDFGLAPNPFHGFCTLAVCKSQIRKNKHLEIGDWVIGTGSKTLHNEYNLIFAMQVDEKISFDQYWNDQRFELKKPIINGSLVQMYGDNFYHTDKNGKWIQENSAHSLEGGMVNEVHLKKDTGGHFVLVSQNFYYFGENSLKIPEHLQEVCCEGRDMKWRAIPHKMKNEFLDWLTSNFEKGINGDPLSWKEHQK